MGQIWNRISRIARATFNDAAVKSSEQYIRSEDDELRRIIEGLANSKSSQSDNKQSSNTNINEKNQESIRKAAEILGVTIDASRENITTAYRRKIMQVHPDKVIGQSKEIQEKARQKTIELNDAYKLLRDTKGF